MRARIDALSLARALALVLTGACSGCSASSNDPESSAGTGAAAASGGSAGSAGTASEGGSAGTTAGTTGDDETAGAPGSGGASGSAGSSAGDSRDAGDDSGRDAAVLDSGTPGGKLTVFYLDVGGSVMATDVEDPEARTIVEDAGQGPDGIALDLERGHIYWTGMGVPAEDDGFVMRSDLDGANIVTIVPEGGTYTPKQLKIDHENGKLYFSDREGMRVMRSSLDGSELETLVTTGMGATDRSDSANWCVGIALDLAGGYFYWTQKGPDNGKVGSIRRAHIAMPAGEGPTSRSDIEVLFSGLPEPVDLDLELQTGTLYWTDRGDDTINRAPIEVPNGATAANRTDREILIEGVREAIGITLDPGRDKLYFTAGTGGRVGMANLDGSEVVDLLTGRAALTGIAVAALH